MDETTPSPDTAQTRSLDEVLVAMDVVDTLRHRDQIFLKEIDHEGREEDLVARLKEIYAAQGMDVPEETIRDGVRAMADKRFTHEPAKKGFFRRLAIIYVTRARWWKPAAIAGALVLGTGTVYQLGVAMPRAAAERSLERDLTITLPAALAEARDDVLAIAETETGIARAEALYRQGQTALEEESRASAESAVDALTALRREIAAQYQVRVVNDPDDFTGIYREHDDLPGRQNYYLIVEAVSPTGEVLDVTVRDEETNEEVRVNRWGQRVSRTVFEGVAADKQDDMIIQDAIIGQKDPGAFEPTYSVSTPGGAITEW